MLLSAMGLLLVLRDDGKYPVRKTKFQGYQFRERITNAAIDRQSLFQR
jgi:hypothetical protein